MRSASRDDLNARARIRDAALTRFGKDGFGVSVRAIAEEAGVSPGLVIHHFGSKDKLRAVCDEHVRQVITDTKTASVVSHDPQGFLHTMSRYEEYAGVLGYIIRSIQSGGELGRHLFEMMVVDAEGYLARGVEEGTIRPSREPEKRARWLAANSIGSILVLISTSRPDAEIDFQRVLRDWQREYMLPALEMFTEGLLTERTMLDAYLLYLGDPPEESH
ncbi:TetR/AcrR family transcriptional regulator [Nocardiopsis alkaliphila]|uniref:TetR/AcrR family transcriptional regulator n=1 Tax=Nocardiopsis alkaliphila TaxID=225762 RepID=UPI000346F122|nr:TetR family transcriptional regulator [Nocardiopsis alkaliphila]